MEPKAKSASSELLSMMGLVAAVVAAVILVFFGLAFHDREAEVKRSTRGVAGAAEAPTPAGP